MIGISAGFTLFVVVGYYACSTESIKGISNNHESYNPYSDLFHILPQQSGHKGTPKPELSISVKSKRYLLLFMTPYTEHVRNHEEGRRAKLMRVGVGGSLSTMAQGNATGQRPNAHFKLYKLLMGI